MTALEYKDKPLAELQEVEKTTRLALELAKEHHAAVSAALSYTQHGFWPGDRVKYDSKDYVVSGHEGNLWLIGRAITKNGVPSLKETRFYSSDNLTKA